MPLASLCEDREGKQVQIESVRVKQKQQDENPTSKMLDDGDVAQRIFGN